ncbi:MAG: hypothetical protein ACRCXA_05150 [Peptostreptococcaceae bacterium]
MAKHPNRTPKYNRKPAAMKIEAARELGVHHSSGVEVNVDLAAQKESKYSKETTKRMHDQRRELASKSTSEGKHKQDLNY